jgi:hypothetical protein
LARSKRKRLRRAASLIAALSLLSWLLVVTAGAALAQEEPIVIPAGFGCAFDVGVDPSVKEGNTHEFGNGRFAEIGHADITLTNLETGSSYLQKSRYRLLEIYDPVTNDVFVQVSGRRFQGFRPGDQGPSGVVGEPGLLLAVVGNQTFAVDLDTELITAYSLTGTTTDICALIS